MAPELFTSMEAEELQAIARKVCEYQQAKGMSDTALLKKFGGLGSTKTYKRILNGDLAELDLEKQLNNYRAVEALMDSMGNGAESNEQLYDDLFPVIELRRVFIETTKENGLARLVILQGPTGSGKSSARKVLFEKFGQRLVLVEASVAWNDSPMAMLGAILKALGKKEAPYNQMDRLQMVLEMLNESRRALVIEEAHHMGPRLLNLCKTLINATPGEFILVTIDTLWKKLESAAYQEALQLTGNRLAERVLLSSTMMKSDVEKILTRDTEMAVKIVLDKAANYGRFAFVRDVCTRVNTLADGEPVTLELFAQAVTEEVKSR